jgi:hypothetical protein
VITKIKMKLSTEDLCLNEIWSVCLLLVCLALSFSIEYCQININKLITEIYVKRVWRYQTSNQNPYFVVQTKQWPDEKRQKDKQRSTKHYTEN